MSKSLIRSFLLILLSITLPLQAAVAASKGSCLRHSQDRQGPDKAAVLAGHGHRDTPAHHSHHSVGHFGNHNAGLSNSAGPEQQAAQPTAAGADRSAVTSTGDEADCPHHRAAKAPAATTEPDCTSCGWCCMGTALPSQSLCWPASLAQQAPTPALAWAHVSPPLRALERPPRAPLSAA